MRVRQLMLNANFQKIKPCALRPRRSWIAFPFPRLQGSNRASEWFAEARKDDKRMRAMVKHYIDIQKNADRKKRKFDVRRPINENHLKSLEIT